MADKERAPVLSYMYTKENTGYPKTASFDWTRACAQPESHLPLVTHNARSENDVDV